MTQNRICLPYFSAAGHTRRLAHAIAEGVAGRDARPIDITEMTTADWKALDVAEAIVFGAPTYMGSTAAQFDLFLEQASDRWDQMPWATRSRPGSPWRPTARATS